MLPVTASELRGTFYNYRGVATREVVRPIYDSVLQNSKYSTSQFFDLTRNPYVQLTRTGNNYIPTVDEIIDVLKTLFPDCVIECTTTFENEREHYGIRISWS